jgi:hypothetical protein
MFFSDFVTDKFKLRYLGGGRGLFRKQRRKTADCIAETDR